MKIANELATTIVKVMLVIMLLLVSYPLTFAAGECDNTAGNTTQQSECDKAEATASLPEDALAEVKELDVKMRFFMSIGMHKRSRERRDAIIAIYEKHGVETPDVYVNWK